MTTDGHTALPSEGWLIDEDVVAEGATIQFWGPRDFAHGAVEDTGGPCRELVLYGECSSRANAALIAAAPRLFLALEDVLQNVPLSVEREALVRAALEAAQVYRIATVDEIDGGD